jgi:hypothetical protein
LFARSKIQKHAKRVSEMANEERKSRVREIISQADETLQTSAFGLHLVNLDDPHARKIGLRNTVVFGRAVTNIIQNLRSVVDDFDDWYGPWVTRMKADETMQYLYKVRSEILKKGELKTGITMSIQQLDTQILMSVVPSPPPGATSFIIGDSIGGTGWEIALPNGETEMFYVNVPETPGLQFKIDVHFAASPLAVRDKTIQQVCTHYVDTLRLIVEDARQKFCS